MSSMNKPQLAAKLVELGLTSISVQRLKKDSLAGRTSADVETAAAARAVKRGCFIMTCLLSARALVARVCMLGNTQG